MHLVRLASKQLGFFLLHRLTSGNHKGGAIAGSHLLNNHFLSKVHKCMVCIICDFVIGRFATARFAVTPARIRPPLLPDGVGVCREMLASSVGERLRKCGSISAPVQERGVRHIFE